MGFIAQIEPAGLVPSEQESGGANMRSGVRRVVEGSSTGSAGLQARLTGAHECPKDMFPTAVVELQLVT